MEQLKDIAVWIGESGHPPSPRLLLRETLKDHTGGAQTIYHALDVKHFEVHHEPIGIGGWPPDVVVNRHREPNTAPLEVDELMTLRTWLEPESLDIEPPHGCKTFAARPDENACQSDDVSLDSRPLHRFTISEPDP